MESSSQNFNPTTEDLLADAQREIASLKEQLKKYRLEDHFVNNDADVLYYTGFPNYLYLKNILREIDIYLTDSSKITKFQQLLLTCIKLRLNFDFTYLGKIFEIHRTAASRIFERVRHQNFY